MWLAQNFEKNISSNQNIYIRLRVYIGCAKVKGCKLKTKYFTIEKKNNRYIYYYTLKNTEIQFTVDKNIITAFVGLNLFYLEAGKHIRFMVGLELTPFTFLGHRSALLLNYIYTNHTHAGPTYITL